MLTNTQNEQLTDDLDAEQARRRNNEQRGNEATHRAIPITAEEELADLEMLERSLWSQISALKNRKQELADGIDSEIEHISAQWSPVRDKLRRAKLKAEIRREMAA